MLRFAIVSAFVILTAVLLAWATETEPAGDATRSRESVLGLRVVSIGSEDPAWLQLGGAPSLAPGVLTVGLGGIGIVTYGLYGAGVLFATGQVAVGLFAIGQLAIGVVFVICQLGAGLSGIGQVLGGGLVVGQGTLGGDGKKFLERLNRDVNVLLSWNALPKEEDA